MICNQENIDRLRALAERALADVPGERVVAPFGDSVWSQTEALYGTIPHAHFIPHEMRFAAEAQNALLPLLDEIAALRAGGGDTRGHETPAPEPPKKKAKRGRA